MQLHQQIDGFLQKHAIAPKKGVVVAVSTGVDSMVLLHALQQAKCKIVVAHVNHGMRKASAAEEAFLVDFCKSKKIPFEILHLGKCPDGENFQQWARQQRYAFFTETAQKYACQYIATAHHADDKTETFLMHALRGSGLNGLTSLAEKNGNIIRPLWALTKAEIIAYAQAENLTWHEDASNQKDDYLRNRLRHNVLPEMEKAHPSGLSGLVKTQHILAEEKALLTFLVENWQRQHVKIKGDEWIISLEDLPAEQAETLLFHLLQNIDSTLPFSALANAKNDAVGSFYLGKTHRVLRDRNELLVTPITKIEHREVLIHQEDRGINAPISLSFSQQNVDAHFSIGQLNLTKNDAALDFDKLTFPLTLRPWQPGDKFVPLGMKGFKKISDYLIDNKVARFAKENTFVLTSGKEIVWLVGHHISEHFKVGKQTQKMYLGRLHNL